MVTQNNSNISSAGLVVYNGSGTFSADTTTNHNVLVGGASNTITNVTPTANSGWILTSNGVAADPSFKLGSTGALSINVQTFTSNNTYTPTVGMKFCLVQCWGGGGSSGGIAASDSTHIAASGSGGNGGYSWGWFTAATIGASQSVTVGAGGLAPTAGNNNGNNGNDTSLGSGPLISALHGTGGTGSASATFVCNAAGSSSAGSGGNINVAGWPCLPSFGLFATNSAGVSGWTTNSATLSDPIQTIANADTAQSIGTQSATQSSGGAGSVSHTSGTGSGGAGQTGLIIITEYVFN